MLKNVIRLLPHDNLYVGEKAKVKAAKVGLLLKANLTSEESYEKVEKIIDVYTKMEKQRETFNKF